MEAVVSRERAHTIQRDASVRRILAVVTVVSFFVGLLIGLLLGCV